VALTASPQAERLVHALQELSVAQLPPFVLVGGLAVMVRLATVHRATSDIDAVTGSERFLQIAVDGLPAAALDAGRLTVAGVRVDTIEVDTSVPWAAIAEVADPLERLFLAGHLWALHDATPVAITTTAAVAVVRVATPRSLLVAKLHAYLSPRRDRAKRGSDALDVLRLGQLVVSHGRPAETGLDADLPDVVASSADWALGQVADDPARLVARVRSVPSAGRVSAPEVHTLVELLRSDLRGGPPAGDRLPPEPSPP
jgi:hypothetical protein